MTLWCLLLLNTAYSYAEDVATPATSAAVVAPANDLPNLLGQLVTAEDFEQKALIIQQLALRQESQVLPILSALLEGQLHYNMTQPSQLVIVATEGDDPIVTDALTAKPLGTVSQFTLDMVSVNNALRGELRTIIARLQLSSPDKSLRLAAAKQLISNQPDSNLLPILEQQISQESASDVKALLTTVVGLVLSQSEELSLRLQAIEKLTGSLYPEVSARLQEMADNDADTTVKHKAQAALTKTQQQIKAYQVAENIFFGLSLGSVLLLAAVGLAITFGVMGVINMAHGELMMLGAYTTYVLQQLMPQHLGLSLVLSIPAAFIVAGLVGIAIERGVIRFLYGRPLETLLATFGISLILQQAVRSIFSPLNRAVASPEWMSGSLEINPVWSITYNRLYILLFALAVFFVLLVVLKRTALGLKLRAVAQNRAMARAVGVRADWMDALTFGLGAGIAGIAGVALSQLTNVGPNLGQAYIIDSFLVVVFGGVGNLWGTLVGAFGLGIANKFLEPYAGAVLAKVLVLVFIILFIQKRPRGLFPQKGRAVES
ncbi:amino acid/amide ABC transporter membrane protein 1 (HAAT family) [Agitococcus lubricus]|uniref:Amino acid/amide ABC transporter membrane protein 1 (HAAT family) n=2 Tax=Agitococcus lubricus TaxID=1077255 RepID=A0A2T5IY93_9GAMM|nr:amino acid/amide ABC transporter membrane protein 1 (HAAT family) [Agitococcus lubricus]